jgi:hypothetical protein
MEIEETKKWWHQIRENHEKDVKAQKMFVIIMPIFKSIIRLLLIFSLESFLCQLHGL